MLRCGHGEPGLDQGTEQMCGRFTLTSSPEVVADLFDLAEPPPLTPRYNIAPTQESSLVRVLEIAGERKVDFLRWGLIPHWARDPSIGNRMINARSETVENKPAFRASFRKQRCLIPSNGFFEWQRVGKRKQPYYIRMRDGRPFALAGLWDRWKAPDGEAIDSFTILTTEANDLVRPLHDRMPVILVPRDYELWLDPEVLDPRRLKLLLGPSPSNELVADPVDTRVNNPANDDAHCVAPLERFG